MDRKKAYHIISICLGSRNWADPENFTEFYSDRELRIAMQQIDLKSLQELAQKFNEDAHLNTHNLTPEVSKTIR